MNFQCLSWFNNNYPLANITIISWNKSLNPCFSRTSWHNYDSKVWFLRDSDACDCSLIRAVSEYVNLFWKTSWNLKHRLKRCWIFNPIDHFCVHLFNLLHIKIRFRLIFFLFKLIWKSIPLISWLWKALNYWVRGKINYLLKNDNKSWHRNINMISSA